MTWVVRAIRSNEGSSVHDLSPSPRARCTIEMKFWSRKAGDGQATARIGDGPDSPGRLTKNRTLAQTAQGASRKSAVWSVRGSQNALFRRMRFSSPAQTRRRLTENRTLQLAPHGKPHSATRASRKSALCPGASPKLALCARRAPLNMVPRRSRLTHHQGSGAQSARFRRCHSRESRPWVCLRCPG